MVHDWLRALRADLTSESYRPAVLAGLASVPFTVALSWELVVDGMYVAGGTVSGLPLVLAGLFVGYLCGGRDIEAGRAGFVAGIAGSGAVAVLYVLNLLTTVAAEPTGVVVFAAVATPFLLVLGALLCGVVTMVAAILSGWATTRRSGVLPVSN